ncbi:MAG: carbohydrate ABC transporter permease [Ruminococcaceae bacterium]|nr:carbohydrate ABC transporter permease [Oscillospiraceae bacterium]
MKSIAHQSSYARSNFGGIVNLLLLGIFAAAMALPMVFTVANAFKPLEELFIFPPTLYVKNPTLNNFAGISSVLRESWVPTGRFIINSVVITAFGVLGQVIFASLAAYVLAKEVFPGSKLLNKLIVLSLMFNGTVTSIPTYIIMANLKIVNTHLALILPACASSLGLFLMKQFMEQMVHTTILEAARVDGAGELRIFFQIVMPMCKPAWLTLIILSFQSLWGNMGGLYIYDDELKTLPYALQNIMSGNTIARSGVSSAVALLLIIPPLVTFILSQSNILETMGSSGIKE